MAKFSIIIICLITSLFTDAQDYGGIVPDSEITSFMTWLLKTDTAQELRNINEDITALDTGHFSYMDTSKLYNFLGNIFVHINHLDTLFTKADADFFVEQIRLQNKQKWRINLTNIKLTKYKTPDENARIHKIIYSYSLPIFSVNKQYVIIVESFCCGLNCGSGHYSIFKKQVGLNSWKKVNEFNDWAE